MRAHEDRALLRRLEYVGVRPGDQSAVSAHLRWTGVLAAWLGAEYRVVEEGLNGRTTRWDDPIEPGRNGLITLRPCIDSHQPLDLIIVGAPWVASAGAVYLLVRKIARRTRG